MLDLIKKVKKSKQKRILVIGDLILDKFTYGQINRISPEAPVQVVKVEEEIYELGGAANVASNIKSLNGNVKVFGFAGDDEYRKIMENLFKEKRIDYCIEKSSKTTLKNRFISKKQHQQLLRVDYEDNSEKIFSSETKKRLEQEINDSNIILLSDYAKGAITKDLMNFLKKSNLRIIIDPKPENKKLYKGAFLITPNRDEALLMASRKDIKSAGNYLRKKLNSNVLVTLGEKGMMLFSDKDLEIPTYAREVFDVTGAGDTVNATLALFISSGSSLKDAAILANYAAGIAVSNPGTYNVKLSELEERVSGEKEKIKTPEQLRSIIADLKRKNKKVIWTNGCFDLLHEGHVNYLRRARELGDCLVVGINSDLSIRKLKGKNRPIINENARMEIISSLEAVDYVMLFPETSVEKYMQMLKPNTFVKAGDYSLKIMNQNERKAIESYGGEITFIPIKDAVSTTEIIKKIRKEKE